MKGAIKTEEIDGTKYDIKMTGSEEALESQSIMISIILKSGMPTDGNISDKQYEMYMMSAMTRDVVSRIKELFKNCINAPIIDDDSFGDIPATTIPALFMAVYGYLTEKAVKKKEMPKKPTK